MMDDVTQSPREEDWGLNKVRNWTYKMCWRPNTCYLSGEQLWGKRAYHGTRIITGPGEPIIDNYWVSKEKFTVWQLTK